jgi:hypothetical protein
MSRHWKPEVVTPDWTRADAYRRSRWGVAALVLLGAAALGFGGAFLLGSQGPPVSAKPDAPIEWNAVQAVPTRPLTADEIAWEKRGQDDDRPATGAGPADDGRTVSGQQLYVIDGDTFDINGTRIRIAGIDAPETHPSRCPEEARLGQAATEELAELLRGTPLWISGTRTDRYGREVRTVRVAGVDVADTMIAAGLARNYDGGKRQAWC